MLDKFAQRLLSPINTAGIGILGIFNILMGIWISLPFDALSFIFLGPEWIVASVLLVVGSFILSGTMKENRKILLIGAQSSFYSWFLSVGGLIYLSWQSPIWIVALMIAAYSMFVAVNIKVNKDNLPFKKV
jgi:hypothetical protein